MTLACTTFGGQFCTALKHCVPFVLVFVLAADGRVLIVTAAPTIASPETASVTNPATLNAGGGTMGGHPLDVTSKSASLTAFASIVLNVAPIVPKTGTFCVNLRSRSFLPSALISTQTFVSKPNRFQDHCSVATPATVVFCMKCAMFPGGRAYEFNGPFMLPLVHLPPNIVYLTPSL